MTKYGVITIPKSSISYIYTFTTDGTNHTACIGLNGYNGEGDMYYTYKDTKAFQFAVDRLHDLMEPHYNGYVRVSQRTGEDPIITVKLLGG